MVEEKFYTKSEGAQVSELIRRYRDIQADTEANITADYVRLNRWDGQSDDGRKWQDNQAEGVKVFPWDGASDTRIPIVDQVIRDITDMLSVASSRANLRIAGVDATDSPQATAATHLVRWLTDTKLRRQVSKEKKLAANFAWTYGRTLIYVGWDEEIGYKHVEFDLQSIQEAIPDIEITSEPQLAELIVSLLPHVEKSDAKEAAKDLFAGEQVALPIPVSTKSEPCIKALEPNRDYVVPDWTGDIQDASEIYIREEMTIAGFRNSASVYGWDEKWADKVVETRGDTTPERDLEAEINQEEVSRDTEDERIEIVKCLRKMVDDDGRHCVYVTVFSPHVDEGTDNDLYGDHYELEDAIDGNYPVVEYRAESHDRRHDHSRGVPTVAFTWQNEIKTQRDALADRASLDVLPPIKVNKRLGTLRAVGSGVQIPVNSPDDFKFEGVTGGNPQSAVGLMELIERQIDAYYGRPNASLPPAVYMTRQQAIVDEWLDVWSEVFRIMFGLCVRNWSPEKIARITGTQAPLTPDVAEYDFRMLFDVRELDNDYLKQKWEAITNLLLPIDSGGAIDRNRIVALAAQSLLPEAAGEIIVDPNSASQKLFEQVKQDVGGIALGMPANMVEGDPTAAKKLEYLQALLQQSQRVVQAITSSEETQKMFEQYIQNLQFNVAQERNKQIGRIGVDTQQ